ncbi:MAG: RNA polymerase sigma factor [Chitinophagales bacterium]
MQSSQFPLKKYKILIQKIFKAYCIQESIYLSEDTQRLLFQKLCLYLQKNWQNALKKYGAFIPEKSLVTELVRLGCDKLLKNNNAEDLELLQNAAGKLVLKYYSIIKHIVYKQNAKDKSISKEEQADIIANIQARLLEKAKSGKLIAQYKGNALFSTYFYKIAYNSMIDEWRKIKRIQMNAPSVSVDLNQESIASTTTVNIEYNDIVEQHAKRLQILIQMLSSKRRRRFEFALKIVYKMKLVTADIRSLYERCSDSLLVEILSYFGTHYHKLAQSQIFVLIGTFLSALEKTSTPINPASFRIWFQTVLNRLKDALFERLPTKDKKAIEAYFEFLVYKMYKRK